MYMLVGHTIFKIDNVNLQNGNKFCREKLNSHSNTVIVRATAVGRDMEQDVEQNAVLAGDPKCLVYYIISKLNRTYLAGDPKRKE